jgi:hypothetical protein
MKYLLIAWMLGGSVPAVPKAEFDNYSDCANTAQVMFDDSLRSQSSEKASTLTLWVCIEKK